MAVTVFPDLGALRSAVGTHLGYSDWLEITAARLDDFALAVGVGPDESGPDGPGPDGPGPDGPSLGPYLALSLSNYFLPQIVEVRGISMGVNYGANEIRFPAPIKAGSRLRGAAELVAAEPVTGGVQAQIRITVEIEGAEEPACVVESLSRYLA